MYCDCGAWRDRDGHCFSCSDGTNVILVREEDAGVAERWGRRRAYGARVKQPAIRIANYRTMKRGHMSYVGQYRAYCNKLNIQAKKQGGPGATYTTRFLSDAKFRKQMEDQGGGATQDRPPLKRSFFDRAVNPEAAFQAALETFDVWRKDSTTAEKVKSLPADVVLEQRDVSRSSTIGWTALRRRGMDDIPQPFEPWVAGSSWETWQSWQAGWSAEQRQQWREHSWQTESYKGGGWGTQSTAPSEGKGKATGEGKGTTTGTAKGSEPPQARLDW